MKIRKDYIRPFLFGDLIFQCPTHIKLLRHYFAAISTVLQGNLYPVYWLVLCVNLTQAAVITEKGASLQEMPP